jgi:hypothetical protein
MRNMSDTFIAEAAYFNRSTNRFLGFVNNFEQLGDSHKLRMLPLEPSVTRLVVPRDGSRLEVPLPRPIVLSTTIL